MGLSWTSWAVQLAGAVVVQLFMVVQCGITFLFLRWKHRHGPVDANLSPLQVFSTGLVSVIIPAYNEAGSIEALLMRLQDTVGSPDRVEVIVVDAGGTDGTMDIARRVAPGLPRLNIRTDVSARGGRGPTLRAGADAAKGDILLFLHADTMLPDCFDAMLRTELSDERVLATAFRFRVSRDDHTTPIVGLGWMEFTVHVRSALWQLPFGDQAIGISKQRYHALGGFPHEPIMEDFQLVQQLRRNSAAGVGYIKTLPAAAECSSRRWQRMGVARTNAINQMIMIAYTYLGYSPTTIYNWYYSKPAEDGAKAKKAS